MHTQPHRNMYKYHTRTNIKWNEIMGWGEVNGFVSHWKEGKVCLDPIVYLISKTLSILSLRGKGIPFRSSYQRERKREGERCVWGEIDLDRSVAAGVLRSRSRNRWQEETSWLVWYRILLKKRGGVIGRSQAWPWSFSEQMESPSFNWLQWETFCIGYFARIK